MAQFSLVATYFAYVFVVVAYYIKVQKYFKMPMNLRWEIYPIPSDKRHDYGGSYMEEVNWWSKSRHGSVARSVLAIVKKYLFMGAYFQNKRRYWVGLYPWHMGFLLIVFFDVLIVIDAIFMKAGSWEISGTAGGGGEFLYYLTLVAGLASFALGCFGSIMMCLLRTFDENLREYAAPQNYANYLFFLVMFVSGWLAWILGDNTFTGFRDFWVGVLSANAIGVGGWEQFHIIIFAAFLIYLPLTRSTHYITKILSLFWIGWNDTPNLGDGRLDSSIAKNLNYEVNWAAPHMRTGKTWAEVATNLPQKEPGKNQKG